MKNALTAPLEISAEISKATLSMAADGGRYMLRELGEAIVQRTQPDYIAPEVLAQQAILKQFEDRFGVAGNLLDREVPRRELEARISWAAYSMVDEGLVDMDTYVELRPLLPEETFYDRELNARREAVVCSLSGLLKQDYGIEAIYNTHPITPSDCTDSEVDAETVWGSIATELEGFSLQIKEEDPQQKVAALAITSAEYEQSIFGAQIVGRNSPVSTDELAVLRHVGSNPHENLLLARRNMGVLEYKELSEFRAPALEAGPVQ